MEQEDKTDRAAKHYVKALTGESLDKDNIAQVKQNREWEQYALSLPVTRESAVVTQNPDGSFPFMLGFDALGDAPLG